MFITCGGGFQGLTLIKHARSLQNIKVVVGDSFTEHPTRYLADETVVLPRLSDKTQYSTALLDAIHQTKATWIVPATDHDLVILDSLRDSFHKLRCTLLMAGGLLLETLLSKKKTYVWLSMHSISTPPWYYSLEEVQFPAYAKPDEGSGGKGAFMLKDAADAAEKIDNRTSYIFVPFLDQFEEYSIDFATTSLKKIYGLWYRKRVRTSGGFAIVSETVSPSVALCDLTNRLIEALAAEGYDALYNVQVIEHSEGLFVSDINPRIGTSAVMHPAVGSSLFEAFMSQPTEIKSANVKVARKLDEIVIGARNFKGVRGFVFDLDDTLLVHKTFIRARCKLLFDRCNHLFRVDESTFNALVEQILYEQKVDRLIDLLVAKFNCETWHAELLTTYRLCWPESVEWYADAEPVLHLLKEKGYKLYILTDNPQQTQVFKLNKCPFAHLFDGVVYTDTLGVEKPDEKAFKAVIEQSGIDSESWAMVGDHPIRDAWGALRAGFRIAYCINRPDGMVQNRTSFMFDDQPSPVMIDSLTHILHELEYSHSL